MGESILIGLVSIIALGILAQWVSWHLKLPSIILLLVFGLLAGPITGFINPDKLVSSELLSSVVSLAVGLILFEGGLGLCFKEIREVRRVTLRLIIIGALVSWLLASLASFYLLNIGVRLSVLLGAILVVTGPTVMIPMLQLIRPRAPMGSILKWEGIMIDPLGATLALLVFDSLLLKTFQTAASHAALGVLKTVLFGTLLGVVAGLLLMEMIHREWIPDFLMTGVSLALVSIVFVASNHFQEESGLLAVTLMGVTLGNQRRAKIPHVVNFSETLGLMLVAVLFIVLSTRVQLADLQQLSLGSVLFLITMIVVVRPVSVFLATVGSPLSLKERTFLSSMAPRGIVAAAVTSVFAYRLQQAGFHSAKKLVPIVFLVIFGTVLFYGLFSPWMARKLKVSEQNPQGFLFVGAQLWIRELAKVLMNEGFSVRLVDTNPENVFAAKMDGLPADRRNILSNQVLREMVFDDIGRVLCVTPNDNVNSLAVLHLQQYFSKDKVFQIACKGMQTGDEKRKRSDLLRGRILFNNSITFFDVQRMILEGYSFKKTSLTEQFTFEHYLEEHGEDTIPMFVMSDPGAIRILTSEEEFKPKPGESVICLVKTSLKTPTPASKQSEWN